MGLGTRLSMCNTNNAIIFSPLAPLDYSSTLTPLIFAPGGPSQMCASIPIINDDSFETLEVFSAILENLDGTAPTDPSTASIIITDDDSEPQIKFCIQWNPSILDTTGTSYYY